ncbi:histidine kinase [Alkalilimnicola ehrlichii]|uniref:histidine kinase n=1 Tax=Alkalilimnicola ehrlichii TaxID=351052 RepID=A0A3E0WK96_9GAMM|nr:ATP-binding protein [Alkalilimnicola ehrlichii]RFA25512.1 histidine kinase [Alkalilimnicola ehrlichii]RFA32633.1 histidine kinase [Alkalilimnicola ehrlichii]
MNSKEKLLEQLTGVDSSKLNYYVELKQRNQEVLKQNSRLEILQQLTRDLNIDMSFEDIVERAFRRLPAALPCDFLGLANLSGETLTLTSVAPKDFPVSYRIASDSLLWSVLTAGKATTCDPCRDPAFATPHAPDSSCLLRSLAVAPLSERGNLTGLLLLGSRQAGAYTPAELNFVQHLADQLAISMQNARLYEQVSRAQKQWEATFKAVTDPIFLIDTDYHVLQHNDRLPVELSDVWREALAERCFARLHGGGDCPLQALKRHGQPLCRRWQTDSGRLLDLYYYPVLDREGQLNAATILMKDVTERTKLQAQLVQSAKLAALGEMAAGVAHELNSPMTVILGTAQLLARELAPEEAEPLEDIVNCSRRCKEIVQNLLTFSRQDRQPAVAIDLNAEVARVLSLIRYQINRSQIRIVERLQPGLPTVTANGSQIQQVLTNLLVNARDALASVTREEKCIEVSTVLRGEGAASSVVLSVLDNGCGIASEELTKIFAPFYTSKEAAKGTGLGLSVSLGIAESHGGTLEVESRLGRGSRFSLILPLTAEVAPRRDEDSRP